ncbi:relaxin-3-like [Brienomyrus brachyistius]|uniref:relaxin-3-like n=1 Tax=Brienomyrus brachyistius TaxID=42636 RepID=UPI0020B2B071|nr:relaxin-3-like [Brienomyrus brachyistius]
MEQVVPLLDRASASVPREGAIPLNASTAKRNFEVTMKGLLLPLLLLWAACALKPVRGEATAVKLCGREFIRAVVYTCGGSRWRRVLDQPESHVRDAEDQSSLENLTYSQGMSKSRRDLNQVLTTVCCQVGCRKSDLTFLC